MNRVRVETHRLDVYDAAALSVVSELSERSVTARCSVMEFPDFTRGRWRLRPRLEIGA
jgi:hypothetical protein